jgi:hypothetical protein
MFGQARRENKDEIKDQYAICGDEAVSDPAAGIKVALPADRLWSVAKLPIQILLLGLTILLLAWLSSRFYMPLFNQLVAALGDAHANSDDHPLLQTGVAILIFIVGVSFAAFLWWVVDRYFRLISSGTMTADQLADLKDLPMGLPEGSVRSLLALIVAVVGLPLLAFSKVMHLDPSIGGYLNGIITGVFGFYFGTRSSSAANSMANQAIDQITDAKSRADQAENDRDQAQADAQSAKSVAQLSVQAAAAAARAAGFGSTVTKLNREMDVASTILNVIQPALPAGILPAGLTKAVSTAQTALDAVQGVTKDTVTDGQNSLLQDAVGALLGGASTTTAAGASQDTAAAGSSAALGALVKTAAPMLSSLGIPGIGEVTALIALLSVGMKLGSQEYARWRARVLAAPLAHGLIEFGTVTPDDAAAALLDAPIFAKAFAEERDRAGFDADLADAALRDDALDRLWQRYGTGVAGQQALFNDRGQLEAGLTEFDQVLLASRSAADIPDGLPDTVTTTLADAKHPDIRAAATSTFTRDSLNKIVNTASKASAPSAGTPKNTQAAFDALVTLVGHSRQNGTDLIGSLAEVTP